ncbi:MAG: GntR family transcriptional regulator [Candidatus Hydrogenedentes bacterium]|nr:GntR family transcriptional regulator [Candidatus Hydrogenedentota bacterium]
MLEWINPESDIAVFVQIENEVRFAIASGALKGGDKLPPVRAVAERLKLNPNTVAKAYRDLEITGLVYSRRGMGIFVRDGVAAKCKSDCHEDIAQKMHTVIAEAKAAGLKESDIRNLTKACFAAKAAPYATAPRSVLAALKGK